MNLIGDGTLSAVDKDACDVYTLEAFQEITSEGGIIEYDGSGHYARYEEGILYEDRNTSCFDKHEGFTHITWYNK